MQLPTLNFQSKFFSKIEFSRTLDRRDLSHHVTSAADWTENPTFQVFILTSLMPTKWLALLFNINTVIALVTYQLLLFTVSYVDTMYLCSFMSTGSCHSTVSATKVDGEIATAGTQPISIPQLTIIYYLSHCCSIACDRLRDRRRLCVCLSSLLRSQFWIKFDETLHSRMGPENCNRVRYGVKIQ